MAVVLHAAVDTGSELKDFLAAFGTFLAGGLLNVYRPFIDPTWKLLDVLEHTEASIHHAVRLNDPAAHPPRLSIDRVGPDRVEIDYRSPRMLCALAKGIVQGLSDHYGEPVRIEDLSCMYSGDGTCRLSVTRS
jgi:hypothetical protein